MKDLLLESTTLSPELIIDRSGIRPNSCMKKAIDHIVDVEAFFVFSKGNIYPILYHDEVCGCLWEYIPGEKVSGTVWGGEDNTIHFGIFTYPYIQNRGLHIVKKYLDSRSGFDMHLHTMKDCNIAGFYESKYHFLPYAKKGNHIVLAQN